MDKNRPVEDALARELETALGVTPSPDFVPRVRRRLATESVRGRWTPHLWGVCATAAVIALMAVPLLVMRDDTPLPTSRARVPVPSGATIHPPAAAAPAEAARPDDVGNIPVRRVAAGPSRARPERHEPVMPRGEIAAIRGFIAQAQRGAFTFDAAAAAVPVPQELSPPPDIVVSPILLLPLAADTLLE